MKFFNDKTLKNGAVVLGVFLGGEAIVAGKHHVAIMPSQDHMHQEPYQAQKISRQITITMSTSADFRIDWLEQKES